MTAFGPRDYSPLPPPGSTVVDIDGVAVGRVAAVVSSPTGQPMWVTVSLAGTDTVVIAPLTGADRTATGVVLGVDAAALGGAPRMAPRAVTLTAADESAASIYYRRRTGNQPVAVRSGPPPQAAPHDGTPGSSTSDAPETSMIRSREDLVVRTERYPYRRVRLRKRVVTEERTITVTVRREEFVIDGVDLAMDSASPDPDRPQGPSKEKLVDGADVLEMTLYAERPTVSTEVVAVERIRAKIAVVDGDPVVVTENVRREEVQIERE